MPTRSHILIKEAESLAPIRTKAKRGNKELVHPVYCNITHYPNDEMRSTVLSSGEAAIYAVAFEPLLPDFSNALAIGETAQLQPIRRIVSGYIDRLVTMKKDSAQTITGLQHILIGKIRSGNLDFGFYSVIVGICNEGDRRQEESAVIKYLLSRGAPLLNRAF